MPWQGAERSELEQKILNELEAGKFKLPKRDIPKSITTFSLSAINPSVMREAVELMDEIYESYQSIGKSPPIQRDDYSKIKKKLEDLKRHRQLKEPERELDFKEIREIGAYPKIKALLNTIKEVCNDSEISNRVIDIKKRLVCKVIPNFKRNWEEIYSPNIYSCIFAERLQSLDSQTDCTKKYTPRGNSLASLLYILDERVHLLFFDMGGKFPEPNPKIAEPPQALAILMEVEDKNRKKYLLIEGVLSNEAFDELIPLQRFPNLPLFLNKTYKRAYHFVNDSIKKYAHWCGTRRFLSTYQVQSDDEVGPLQYVDCLKEIYQFRYNYDYEKLPADKEKKGDENGWLVPKLEDLVSHGKLNLTKSNFDLEETLSERKLTLIMNRKRESTYFTQAFTTANLENGRGDHGPWRRGDVDGCWGECTGEVYGKDLSELGAAEEECCPSEKYYIPERKEHIKDESHPTKALEVINVKTFKKDLPTSSLGKVISAVVVAAIGIGSYFAWSNREENNKNLPTIQQVESPSVGAVLTPNLGYDEMAFLLPEETDESCKELLHFDTAMLKEVDGACHTCEFSYFLYNKPPEMINGYSHQIALSPYLNQFASTSLQIEPWRDILPLEKLTGAYDEMRTSVISDVVNSTYPNVSLYACSSYTTKDIDEVTPRDELFLGNGPMVSLRFNFGSVDNDYQLQKVSKKKKRKTIKVETVTTFAPDLKQTDSTTIEAGYRSSTDIIEKNVPARIRYNPTSRLNKL